MMLSLALLSTHATAGAVQENHTALHAVKGVSHLYDLEPIQPIPLQQDLDERKLALGSRLFAEPRLSRDRRYRCTTCHDLGRSGVDGRARPLFRFGMGKRNVPTLYNVRFNLAYAWDGRFRTVEAYIDAVLTDPATFDFDWPSLTTRLQKDSDYQDDFQALYQEGVTRKSVVNAIATYVRSLTTTDSRFDRFLRGDPRAITRREKMGYDYFKSYGCATCHNGAGVGGTLFQRMGVLEQNRYGEEEASTTKGMGRDHTTSKVDPGNEYKVPSLRLATLTAPYFHDGSVASLEAAIGIMGRYQIGREIPAEHIELLVEFLATLVGNYRGGRP